MMLERTAVEAAVQEIEDTLVATRAPCHVTCAQSHNFAFI